ncbi:MAG TPA: hypothetical protein VH744_02850 [Terriglobales bacterium]|jgi:hypothetical protein
MMLGRRVFIITLFFGLCCSTSLPAQDPRPGLLSIPEIKAVVPAVYFFRGQSATVQVRNSTGFRGQGGKLVLAGLVDNSGYARDVAEKYQGFLISEVKLNIEGSDLPPGQYGFGFGEDGRFRVMDVGANDLFTVASKIDENLRRPVPLKITEDSGAYRLYAGRKWVGVKAE